MVSFRGNLIHHSVEFVSCQHRASEKRFNIYDWRGRDFELP